MERHLRGCSEESHALAVSLRQTTKPRKQSRLFWFMKYIYVKMYQMRKQFSQQLTLYRLITYFYLYVYMYNPLKNKNDGGQMERGGGQMKEWNAT